MSTSFATSDGLRVVLTRLDQMERVGHLSWRTDREARLLMGFTIRKYRSLATAHHCRPEDSAMAAFEAMRSRAVMSADDPWAVITRAVQVSLIAEERSAGLLCSPAQARRRIPAHHHDARRFCEYDTDPDHGFHPLLRTDAEQAQRTDSDEREDERLAGLKGRVDAVKARIIDLFVAFGWPETVTTCAIDYICARVPESLDKDAAHELLRRDDTGRGFLDLDRRSWTVLLRLMLGNPDPDLRNTRAGRGLFRLLCDGCLVTDLVSDDGLIREISSSAPSLARRHDDHTADPDNAIHEDEADGEDKADDAVRADVIEGSGVAV